MDREPVSKKTRFEVFKRDKFTCQYCGAKAPEVVLHLDHIHPVAEGGKSDILNLLTACAGCNGGKGKRLISDETALNKQRKQIEELQERREQLEMMLDWRNETERLKADELLIVTDAIVDRTNISANETGKKKLRRWIKTYGVPEVLAAADEAFDEHLEFKDDEATIESWGVAFLKIPAYCKLRRMESERPNIRRLLYIQGILRNRCDNKHLNCIEALEEQAADEHLSIDTMELFAKRATSWEDYCQKCNMHIWGTINRQ